MHDISARDDNKASSARKSWASLNTENQSDSAVFKGVAVKKKKFLMYSKNDKH